MEPRELSGLMGRLDGPSVVPTSVVKECKTWRQAVRKSWELRRVRYMTHAQLAAEASLTRQHVSDYLNPDDKHTRRDLPAEAVHRWNVAVGNTLCTQWLNAQDRLTVLEEMQATRAAA